MSTRSLFILATLTLGVMISCWVALEQRYPQRALEQQQNGLVFPRLQHQLEEIVEIGLDRAGEHFTLTRRASGWANMGIGGYPAQTAQVEALIGALARLRYLAPKTARPALYRKLSVEDVVAGAGSTRVVLKNAAGDVVADILVGRPGKGRLGRDAGVYIRLPGDQQAWLVSGLPDIRHGAARWSDRSLVDKSAGALQEISIRNTQGGLLELHRAQAKSRKLTVKNLPQGSRIEHQYQIDYIAGLLKDLRFVDARRHAGEERVQFEVNVQLRDQLILTLRTGKPADDGSVWAQITASVEEGVVTSPAVWREMDQINSKFAGWSLKLPRKMADRLRIRLVDIIEKAPEANSPITITNKGLHPNG